MLASLPADVPQVRLRPKYFGSNAERQVWVKDMVNSSHNVDVVREFMVQRLCASHTPAQPESS